MEGHKALLPELDAMDQILKYCAEQKKAKVNGPCIVSMNNKKMGGVDLLDSLVTVHRVSIRRKKWYFPFYTWSLSAATVNAWRLKEVVMKARNPEEYEQEPYISFLMELFQSMLETHNSRPRHANITKKVCSEARLDGKENLPVTILI